MKEKKLIAIETKRYSEFFRRLLQEYKVGSRVKLDGKTFGAEQLPQLIAEWCTNEQIKKTKDFKLSRGKIDLFGFHDSPDEMWAVETELPFVEQLANEKILRFRIMTCRGK
jgi:hypothetical protein